MDPNTLDILIPIQGSLSSLRFFRNSLQRHGQEAFFRYWFAHEGCDGFCWDYVCRWSERLPSSNVVKVKGVGKSLSRGLALVLQQKGSWVLFVRSSVLITPGFLQQMIQAFSEDAKLGMAFPLSNALPGRCVDLWPGRSWLDMSQEVASLGDVLAEETWLPGSSCVMFSRPVLEAICPLSEELVWDHRTVMDWQTRITACGYGVRCVTHAYVFDQHPEQCGLDPVSGDGDSQGGCAIMRAQNGLSDSVRAQSEKLASVAWVD